MHVIPYMDGVLEKTFRLAVLLLSLCSAGAPVSAKTWAVFDGYYVGMSKQEAKKKGLQNCSEAYGEVTCEPTSSIYVAGARSRACRFKMDRENGSIRSISISFDLDDESKVLDEMKDRFGLPRRGVNMNMQLGSSEGLHWERSDDTILVVIIGRVDTGGRHAKSRGILVYSELRPNRERSIRKAAQLEQEHLKRVDSFYSK